MTELTYHGISKERLKELVSTEFPDLSRLPEGSRSYLEKTLDTHKFYTGRMMAAGNNTAENVLNNKYLGPNETGPLHMWIRLADSISAVEKDPQVQEERFYEFMDALDDFKLIPGGRIMHGGGREDIKTTLNNCYVVAIKEDSIQAIYQTIMDEATTYKKGGGCGTNLSILRPEDTNIGGTGGVSCGPTGFMELYSTNTNTIAQHGRRGALMLNISDWHPDIERFITIKNDIENSKECLEALAEKYPWEKESLEELRRDLESRRNVSYANISTLLGHEFIKAVEDNTEFNLRFPDIDSYSKIPEMKKFYDQNWDGDLMRWETKFKKAQEEKRIPKDQKAIKVYGTINAQDLWKKIIHNAHSSAEPGILFWDTMREFHNLEYCSPLSSTNPCGEQPLPDGGCCNLAAVNLERMVNDEGIFDEELFKKTVRTGVRFLDNVIDYNLNRHALETQKQNAINDRRIGLGITGLADMLIKMGIKYDSERGLEIVEDVMKLKLRTEYDESINLAKEKGSFENYDWEGLSKSKFIQNLPEDLQERIRTVGLRNGTINTCAPVGSGAIIAEGSSGIEPIFMAVYERDVKTTKTNEIETFEVFHPLIEKKFGRKGKIPDYVVESQKIDPMFRVKMQGRIQKYVDTSISSTINLPKTVTEKIVGEIYLAAHKEGLKGVTVYVDGSRGGVLRSKNLEDNLEESITDYQAWTKLVKKRLDRERPEIITGPSVKMNTPHGKGVLLNLNYEMTEKGEIIAPYEAVINFGKAGGDMGAIAEAMGRGISQELQAGIPLENIIEQLEGIGGETQYGMGPERVKSFADSIGKALKKAKEQHEGHEKQADRLKNKKNKTEQIIYSGKICPDCGSTKVIGESGCYHCEDCNWSGCS